MPLGSTTSLDALYAKLQLLHEATAQLEHELALLEDGPGATGRRYVLEIQRRALDEEATHLTASISDLLDRDLQR